MSSANDAVSEIQAVAHPCAYSLGHVPSGELHFSFIAASSPGYHRRSMYCVTTSRELKTTTTTYRTGVPRPSGVAMSGFTGRTLRFIVVFETLPFAFLQDVADSEICSPRPRYEIYSLAYSN